MPETGTVVKEGEDHLIAYGRTRNTHFVQHCAVSWLSGDDNDQSGSLNLSAAHPVNGLLR